jgi:hypothetical protein
MVAGVIGLKDHLYEYMFRGEELDGMNFLTFMLDTYDGKAEQIEFIEGDVKGQQQRHQGRLQNKRVPYRQGFNQSGRCRVFRTDGHETLPHFLGGWLPRNDRPKDRELYCASTLALLKPWTDLSQLKTEMESFDQSFNHFMENATKQTVDIIDNIQYYYECYDGAKVQEEMQAAGMQTTIDYEDEGSREDLMDDVHVRSVDVGEVTEEDIELAYEARGMMRERLYAEIAMNTAIEYGVFSEDVSQTVYLPIAERAARDDLKVFQLWGEQLKAACRRESEHGQGNVFMNVDCAAVSPCTVIAQQENDSNNDNRMSETATTQRPKKELLKIDQRRAHDIIEQQLQRRLAGEVELVMN